MHIWHEHKIQCTRCFAHVASPGLSPNHFKPHAQCPWLLPFVGGRNLGGTRAAGNSTCFKKAFATQRKSIGPHGHELFTAPCLGSHVPKETLASLGDDKGLARCSLASGNASGGPQEEAISLRVVGCPVPGPRGSCWERDGALIGS